MLLTPVRFGFTHVVFQVGKDLHILDCRAMELMTLYFVWKGKPEPEDMVWPRKAESARSRITHDFVTRIDGKLVLNPCSGVIGEKFDIWGIIFFKFELIIIANFKV